MQPLPPSDRDDAKAKRSLGPAGWLAVAVLLALLAAAIWIALDAWNSVAGTEMSRAGVAFMILGIVVTFVLGAGLMALVFFSHRKGFDR